METLMIVASAITGYGTALLLEWSQRGPAAWIRESVLLRIVGPRSVFLVWTKPDGGAEDFVSGLEYFARCRVCLSVWLAASAYGVGLLSPTALAIAASAMGAAALSWMSLPLGVRYPPDWSALNPGSGAAPKSRRGCAGCGGVIGRTPEEVLTSEGLPSKQPDAAN